MNTGWPNGPARGRALSTHTLAADAAEKWAVVISAALALRARQSNREDGSLPLAVAVRADGAAMHLYKVANNRKPKSESALSPAYRAIGLAEAVEDVRQKVGTDALSVVAHAQMVLAIL